MRVKCGHYNTKSCVFIEFAEFVLKCGQNAHTTMRKDAFLLIFTITKPNHFKNDVIFSFATWKWDLGQRSN